MSDGKTRVGLYVLVIFSMLNSCSANTNAGKALRILEKQFPHQHSDGEAGR